jgi:DNA-binding NarL/FixJ family response regulator
MSSKTITLGIADDHQAVRQAFKSAFSSYSNLSILFEASNGVLLMHELKIRQPDILLLDIKMPEANGIEALKIIYEKYPQVRVLILTAFLDEVYVGECLKYGINGYLTKTMDLQEILKAIQLASNNEVYYTNLLTNANLKSYLVRYGKNLSTTLPDFSQEEIRIIELLQAEKTTEEIATIMQLSKRSIEMKRDKMKEKAHVKTIGGLLLYCLKRGLIE